MITAKKRAILSDYYPDIAPGKEYEVEKIGQYLKFKNNARRYRPFIFQLYRNGKTITVEQAKAYLILETL